MNEEPSTFQMLRDIAPDLVTELERLLLDQGEPALAGKVARSGDPGALPLQ